MSLDTMAWIEEHRPAAANANWAAFRVLLTGLLLAGDPTLTERTVGAWLSLDDIGRISAAMAEAMRIGMPEERGDPSQANANWAELWAVGRVDLRLTDEQFWSLTPRQFLLLIERQRHDYDG